MKSLFLVLALITCQDDEPTQVVYQEPTQIVYTEPEQVIYVEPESKPLPEFLDEKYRYPTWTWPSNKTIWQHLLDKEDPHYYLLIESGYTDRQLSSLTFGKAKALHDHLHNWEAEKSAGKVLKRPNKIYFAPSS